LLRGIGSHWLLWPRLPASLPLANAPFAKHGRRRRQGVQIISFIAGRDNAEPSIRQSLHREGRGIRFAISLDINGNGKLDSWVEPGQPADPKLDQRLAVSFYAVMPNPADGSVWGSSRAITPGWTSATR
jgi:hypothetical protein